MHRHQQCSLAAALLLAYGAAQAGPVVTRTDTQTQTATSNTTPFSFEFSFAPITGADALISASPDISISGGEGGSFTISVDVDYVGATPVEIYSNAFNLHGSGSFELSNLSFAPGTVDGLTFTLSKFVPYGDPSTVTVNAGTLFSFDTVATTTSVPEPDILPLAGIGMAALLARRSKRPKPPGVDLHESTSE